MRYHHHMPPSLEIKTFILGELETNCYLVWSSTTGETVIIDPADDGDFISEQILTLQLNPTGIIFTHGHFDHVIGSLAVKLNFDLPIMMHAGDTELLARATASAEHWLKHTVDPIPPADIFLIDQQKILIGDQELKVMHTPGHTPGSICLYNHEVIFTGDTLTKDGVGNTRHGYSSTKLLHQSLEKIRQVGAGKTAYSGHGEMFSIT